MKKIIMSLAMIGAVGALVIGATGAYFSDVEVSEGNTFTAGTIDIAIDGENPWVKNYHIGDFKPCETGYINFDIQNVGMNPVNVSKKLFNFTHQDMGEEYDCDNLGLVSSEPECVAEQLVGENVDDVESQIIYDLYVEVYNAEGEKIWWQEIYNVDEGNTLRDVYGAAEQEGYVALGMIPFGGHMLVTQSYHFNCDAGNEYQGDGMMFDMEIYGEQLTGEDGMASVVLENKEIGVPEWNIIQGDGIQGTLSYKTSAPEFEYLFSGVAPLADENYVLAVGYDANTDVDTKIGEGTTDGTGQITINGSFVTGDLDDAKVWLIPAEYWNDGMVWSNWPDMVDDFLWETGLINYIQS